MRKKCVKKHQKLSENAKYYHFLIFLIKTSNSNPQMIWKLTILVVLWKRACYREKAKKKSHAQKYYHPKIQRLGPREFEFSRSKFFSRQNLVKTQQNKTKPIFLAVPLYNYHNGQYSRYSFASKRLFFFSEKCLKACYIKWKFIGISS